ncbi:MAG: heme NO-binding domain-containing protein [Candidatus Kariarchaeaceae archaeon]|jgi:hypothetical protein
MNNLLVLKPVVKGILVHIYFTYILDKFGLDVWSTIYHKTITKKTVSELIPIYGDSLFPILVDLTVELTKESVQDIIEDFSAYYHSI